MDRGRPSGNLKYSASLQSRITFVIERAIGSNGVLMFYDGKPPESADDEAMGEKLGARSLTPQEFAGLREGRGPEMLEGATYWRLHDNGGLVVMQGGAVE